jgi:hypothetical protein
MISELQHKVSHSHFKRHRNVLTDIHRLLLDILKYKNQHTERKK